MRDNWLVYQDVVKLFEFQVPADSKQSEVIRTRRGDAEALTRIYVGILRSNEIPARILRGRYTQTRKSGQVISWIGGQSEIEDDQSYCMSQFHVDDIGWITVDVANYVRNKNPNFHEGKPDTYMGGFGKEQGNFIATCIDKPFAEIPVLGPRSDVHHNDFTIFFEHKKKGPTDWVIL